MGRGSGSVSPPVRRRRGGGCPLPLMVGQKCDLDHGRGVDRQRGEVGDGYWRQSSTKIMLTKFGNRYVRLFFDTTFFTKLFLP